MLNTPYPPEGRQSGCSVLHCRFDMYGFFRQRSRSFSRLQALFGAVREASPGLRGNKDRLTTNPAPLAQLRTVPALRPVTEQSRP